jgi:hypothetical protein
MILFGLTTPPLRRICATDTAAMRVCGSLCQVMLTTVSSIWRWNSVPVRRAERAMRETDTPKQHYGTARTWDGRIAV